MNLTKISDIHPESRRLLRLGHPWITADSFSLKFPREAMMLEILDQNKSLGFFWHDPTHPKIKARFWSKSSPKLEQEIKERLTLSFKKRMSLNLARENFYYVFAEADQLPGLYIQKLGEYLLIQYQAFFWQEKKTLLELILKELGQEKLWWQARLPGEQKLAPISSQNLPHEFVIDENGLKFKINMQQGHDIGVYSDMSAIRESISNLFIPKQKLLNLFSYTGAFSLMGLRSKMDVTSLDLSKKYMSWLEENIALNQFDSRHHHSIISAADKYLTKSQEQFDLIICDPPSFSSNKKTRASAFDFYQEHLKKLASLLTRDGKLLIFLNTHQLSREKFGKMVKSILPQAKIEKELGLMADCPLMPHFSEGDYLKGLVLTKIAEA